MASPYYLHLRGSFVIKGKEPDGDSVRFIADDPSLYQYLHRHYRIKPSRSDGSVQLRFEGVDATEVHYGSAAQPLGKQARDQLLSWMGFDNIRYKSDQSTMVEEANPDSVRGAVLSVAAEANGRPVSYVLLESELPSGTKWIQVDEALLRKTLNLRLLELGEAYYTIYTSMPLDHRQLFRQVALSARSAQRGVWAIDQTSDFVLVNQRSIGPDGQCILPKLFRRCTDYLKDVDDGFQGNLADWIIWISQLRSRSENDTVVVDDSLEIPLSDLLEQRNSHIAFQADLLDIMFVEK